MDWLNEVSSIIILIGAVMVAISNIYKFVKKPMQYGQEKLREDLRNEMEKSLPVFLEKYEAEVREQWIDIAEERIEQGVLPLLEDIREMTCEQNQKIEVLTKSSKDLLQQRIVGIYYKHRADAALPLYIRENLEEIYNDYKLQNGNTFIDRIFSIMMTWEVIEEATF